MSSLFTVGGTECKGQLEPWTAKIFQMETFLGRKGLTLDKPAAPNGLVDRSQDLDPILDKIFRLIHGSYTNKCTHEEILIPVSSSASFSSSSEVSNENVRVLVHTPKNYKPTTSNKNDDSHGPALIYAHGGGFVHFSADSYKPLLSRFAIELNVPIYSVDIRLAPEHKCPSAAQDVHDVLQWLHHNAVKRKVDPTRIGLAGESSGAHTILGTCIMLAERNESNMVKCAFPDIPPCTDYLLHTPQEEMHFVNQQSCQMYPNWMMADTDADVKHPFYQQYTNPNFGHFMWKNLMQDQQFSSIIMNGNNKQSSSNNNPLDPYVFPALVDDNLMCEMPPMVVSSSEFCFFIEDAKHLISRLQQHNKLLDSLVIPGGIHVSWLFGLPGTEQYFRNRRLLHDRHLTL